MRKTPKSKNFKGAREDSPFVEIPHLNFGDVVFIPRYEELFVFCGFIDSTIQLYDGDGQRFLPNDLTGWKVVNAETNNNFMEALRRKGYEIKKQKLIKLSRL